ncbi:MAG: ABC transporter ATP-binding protein [Pseudomonadota bacterium]
MTNPLLSISDLGVSFRSDEGRVHAVNNVSFSIDGGKTLAIVGESGSGKSVTALSILQLLGDAGRIDAGTIMFEGVDLAQHTPSAMRHIRGNQISMIFQEPMTSLNPVIKVGRQVAEPLVLHQGLSWQQALSQAETLLHQVAIPDPKARLEDYPHQLSGGMRQRVMIAMALACSPKLIIADEPTTALDVTVQAQILALLKDLTRQTGAALILITHDLGVVARYADHVVVMYGGRMMESTTAAQLYRTPKHPYTKGLMSAIPSLDSDTNLELATIDGQPPNLANPPQGCPFAPRCTLAEATCNAAPPDPREVGSNHLMACIYDD